MAKAKTVTRAVTMTTVKLCDNERKPVHALCAIEGYCCFERAYQIGRLDEREGRPYPPIYRPTRAKKTR